MDRLTLTRRALLGMLLAFVVVPRPTPRVAASLAVLRPAGMQIPTAVPTIIGAPTEYHIYLPISRGG